MKVITKRHEQNKLETIPLTLISDTHIGSKYVDYDRIEADLKRARQRNARISINGDVFDFVLPGNRKHFRIQDVHPRIFNKEDDMVGAAIEWACEIFEPYADLIDMIGVGNHDENVKRIHNMDAVNQLVGVLNAGLRDKGVNHSIEFGGYCGILAYQIKISSHSNTWVCQYHHGAGGGGPVNKGVATFQRLGWMDGVDAFWRGHTHDRYAIHDVRLKFNQRSESVEEVPILNIRSGSYMLNYKTSKTGSMPYAAYWDGPPKPTGGFHVDLVPVWIRGSGFKIEAHPTY